MMTIHASAQQTATSSSIASVREHAPTELVIDGSVHWSRWWADLYEYRGALQSLMWRNLRSRYKQAALGALWALLQPALQVGVFTLLFGILARVPAGDLPYPLFALAGLLPWNLFSKIISEGATSLVVNQALITKLFFPRIYLVVAVGASALLDAAVTLLLLLALMIHYGVWPGARILIALPALGGVLVLSYGVAAFLAALNARWRDVQHTVPFLLQLGLFATPIIYYTSLVPARWRWLLALNPLTGLVEGFRGAVLGLAWPEPHLLLLSLASSAFAIAFGFWRFTRAESTVVDIA
ncbi:MAG: ABC transporter permease [Gemmatimonadota bacterium]|nr:ABC transporter permease [Gemmatimonadota bacterium]